MHASRYVLTTCALAAALTVAATSSAQPEPQAGDRPLRVMSYNIKHGQTNEACTTPPRVPGEPPPVDCGLDLQASIDVIKSFDPDIIGMQEIDRFWARSDYLDEPAVLSAALGLPQRATHPISITRPTPIHRCRTSTAR